MITKKCKGCPRTPVKDVPELYTSERGNFLATEAKRYPLSEGERGRTCKYESIKRTLPHGIVI